MKPLKHMLYSIGNTPTVQINEFVKHLNGSVGLFAKLEGYNPTGCSTDRAAFGLIKDATKAGMITESTTIVDAVLGNMGPSIAYIARMLGHRCIITAPDTISAYNKRITLALGAQLILTDHRYGIKGAVKKAEEIWNSTTGSYMLRQFSSDSAPDAYRSTLGPELYETFGSSLGALFCGVGSGSTISGTAEHLKQWIPDLKVIAVEPSESAVLSGKNPGPHAIDGLGLGFLPDNYNPYIVDSVACVNTGDAEATCKALFKAEGISAGISSGAVMCAALQNLSLVPAGRCAVMIFPDSAMRYTDRNIF